ncbi:hypothetical protein P12x_002391 [Tundrisphaera lichenicola]|uniref:hypothetical protein n=1 Tax=Tundrisphaera lichenicola TaxID=2029860 RepID=UPI003EC131DF
MSIQITFTPEQERKLIELAHARGKEPSTYAHEIIVAYLSIASPGERRTFEEILTPIWEGWRRSGLTDVEVGDLLEQELIAARSERNRREEAP